MNICKPKNHKGVFPVTEI